MTPSDYIPCRYHDQQVVALTTRAVMAEELLVGLLDYIDPSIRERNGWDWAAAVAELIPPAVTVSKPKRGK